jgi:hypothetical protein
MRVVLGKNDEPLIVGRALVELLDLDDVSLAQVHLLPDLKSIL